MPAPDLPEFRRRAIDLARKPGASVAQSRSTSGSRVRAASLDESGRCRHRPQGRALDRTTGEREELVGLRWENRRLEMELEITKREAALFAQENVLPE